MNPIVNNHTSYYALAFLIVTGFLLRIIWIDTVPSGLNSDELLKAFDGASVWLTGRDHHGAWFPVFFEQSGEFSPPLYIYFSGLFSAWFGITPCTVRLPSILLGCVSIWLTFEFVNRISNAKTALVASLLVALSPWNIFYSRLGWEAIMQVPLQLIALWQFIQWYKTKSHFNLFISTTAFALTFYSYPTERLFIPLMLILTCVVSYKKWKKNYKQLMICAIWFLLLMLPTVYIYVTHNGQMQARWNFLSVFNQPDGVPIFLQQWLLHLSPLFLFITGSHFGMMGGAALLVLLPFFYMGLWNCLYRHSSSDILLLGWFIFFSIPASMTFDRYDPDSMPNSLRTTCGMPILEIISAMGITFCYQWLQSSNAKKMFASCLLTAIAINAGVVLYDYYFRYPNYAIPTSHYGFQELVEYTEAHKDEYDKIIIAHKIGLHPISIAVFSKRPPSPFSHTDYPKYVLPFYHYVPTYHDWGAAEYDRFGLISRWYYQGEGKLLIAAKAGEIDDAEPIHTVRYPNGKPAYQLYEINLKNSDE